MALGCFAFKSTIVRLLLLLGDLPRAILLRFLEGVVNFYAAVACFGPASHASCTSLETLDLGFAWTLALLKSAPSSVRNAGLLAKPCFRRGLSGANPAVGDEARKMFPSNAIRGMTTPARSALLKQASPPWRPHRRIQCVSWGIGSGPVFFYSVSVARLERSSFQSFAGS